MCNYHTCYQNDTKGYIVQCTECRRLQMGYGNIMIVFYPSEFESFRKLVKDLHCKEQPEERRQVKHIVIPTPSDCVRLLLSQDDLAELHGMLEEADNEIKAKQLLQLFAAPASKSNDGEIG
ncbi:MAG: hypothetical protein QM726_25145 [Chitinophagaceae bacterium]